MSSYSFSRTGTDSVYIPGEGKSEHRERMEREHEERLARRQEELSEQTSQRNAPHLRIGWWERLHFMRLPTNPNHPLVGVIAAQTELSLEQVRQEQQRRIAASASAAAK